MVNLTVTAARACFYRLLDDAAATHQPIYIIGKRHNGVLIAEEDWLRIQETLHLLSVPGLRESIRRGLNVPPEECKPSIDW
ncbi:MAG: type II toxin-antitoxin system Phd/YefM family antitoxin [Nevskia sp.]|jgi:PHD/YefM family antitoxin component YafN of YafNO toxin-antitoxin module|nr:type II toxin-antitoxin system Phd/YefM family antitoxin [Nevskia sp.]